MDGQGRPIRVLHVDDDTSFVETAAQFLEREDDQFAVVTASSAEAGLDLVADGGGIDCIVSDYDMPGPDGLDFLQAVRDKCQDIPFILYTGKGSEGIASEAISAGVTDYLRKETWTGQYGVLANRIRNVVTAHRSAQAAERRRHRLEQILKTVPSCVVQLDAGGQFTFANSRAEEVLGLTPDEVTDRTFNDPEWHITDLEGEPIDDEDLPFRQVRDSGEPLYGFRHSIEWPDGTRKVLLVNGAPVFDGEGTVASTVFAIADITEQQEREQELRETSRRLDLALRATKTGVWAWDMETDGMVWSDPMERLMGLDQDAFQGTFEAFTTYIHPDDRPTVRQAIMDAIATNGEFHAEFRLERADGDLIWVEGRGDIFTEDGPRRMLGTVTDIADRKAQEAALARRETLDPSIELEFHSAQIAATIQDEVDGDFELTLDGVVSRPDGTHLLYLTVSGATAKEVQSILHAFPMVSTTRLLSTVGGAVHYEVSVASGSVASIFDAFDGELLKLAVENGTCKLIGEFSETVDPTAVAAALRETYADIELASQRRIPSQTYLRHIIEDDLTDRQRSVLEMAYYAGYFDQPRKSTGDDLAGQLGITRQTFNSHLRKAQARLLHDLFEEAVRLPTD